jgi:hypothetical protein
MLGDELGHPAVDRLAVGTGRAAALVHRHDQVRPELARPVGEDLPGPHVAGHEHEARREPPDHRGDLGGDVVGVVDPLVLGVVLVPVVRPAADADLADLEVVALDRLLLLDLVRPAHVGDVGADPVDDRDDVRHPARQLAQQRQQVRLG